MNNTQRLHYLQAMGIDSYSPRLLLPGAMPSVLLETPVAVVPESSAISSPEMAAAPAAHGAEAHFGQQGSRIEAVFDVPAASEEAVESVNEPASERQVEPPPRIALSMVRGAGLLLIDEGMPGDSNPAEYFQLLQNLLFSLGLPSQDLTVDGFSWPMTRNSAVDQSKEAASEALQSFVERQLEQHQVRYILLLGDTARQYLLAKYRPGAAAPGELVEYSHATRLICAASAVSLLKNPPAKRGLWQQLQPLWRCLQAESSAGHPSASPDQA